MASSGPGVQARGLLALAAFYLPLRRLRVGVEEAIAKKINTRGPAGWKNGWEVFSAVKSVSIKYTAPMFLFTPTIII